MPALPLLPLGTVFKPKDLDPEWKDFRLMVSTYFTLEKGASKSCDYCVTPWPLGFLRRENADPAVFLFGNESEIDEIEFIGCVSEEACALLGETLSDALKDSEARSPIATGAPSIAPSLGDLPTTFGDLGFDQDEMLPLGSVISTSSCSGKLMVVQQPVGLLSTNGVRVDYACIPWPYGASLASDKTLVCSKEEITAVHFIGYRNALTQEITERLYRRGWGGRKTSLLSRIFGI